MSTYLVKLIPRVKISQSSAIISDTVLGHSLYSSGITFCENVICDGTTYQVSADAISSQNLYLLRKSKEENNI